MTRFLALLIGAVALFAQAPAPENPVGLLPGQDAIQLSRRIEQLMESTGAALPELQLASAPLVAGTKRTLEELEQAPLNLALTAALVRQTRAFLAVADATPKPAGFPEAAQQQFTELRNSFERFETHLDALIAAKELETRSPDPNGVKHYADANSRVLPPGANVRVVFLGGSATEGWHLNEYFTGRDFLNRGIAGQTTSQMLGRFKADVLDLHPRAVLILGGSNDIARGTPLNVIENDLIMMSELARVHQVKLLLASVLPAGAKQTGLPRETIQQLNSWIQNYCTQTGCTYVDYYSKLRDPAGMLQADVSDDGLHPDSKGYRLMAPVALAALDHALGASSAPVEMTRHRRVRVF